MRADVVVAEAETIGTVAVSQTSSHAKVGRTQVSFFLRIKPDLAAPLQIELPALWPRQIRRSEPNETNSTA